jgi:translocation and assembly module TamB
MVRRVLRRIGVGVLLAVLLVAFVVVGGLWWFRSQKGQAFVRSQVVASARDAIAGRLDFGSADFVEGHLVLTDVKLFTPEGELVAQVARLELDVDVAAAARGHLRFAHVRLSRPKATLVQDARGLNLLRAVASKTPTANGPDQPLRLTVEDVSLDDGEVSFTDGERRLRLEQVAATGAAKLTTPPLSLTSSLSLTANATDPLTGPVTLTAKTTSPTGGSVRVETDLQIANEVVKGRLDWPSLDADLDEVTVTPALADVLVGPGVLRRTITLRGQLSPRGADVSVRGGAATGSLRGRWDLERRSVEAFTLDADGLDLSEWIEGGPSSRLTLQASGAAADTSIERLSGALEARATWKTSDGRPLGQATAELAAAQGTVTVRKARATVPGATVSLAGRASPASLALSGTLDATDLSQLGSTLVEFTGVAPPTLKGRGSLALGLEGPTRRPRLTAKGTLTDVQVASASAGVVELDLTLPDVCRPLDAAGRFVLRQAVLSGQSLDEASATVSTHGRELSATLATKGLGDATLTVGGTLEDDASALALATLRFDDSKESWVLEKPTRVRWSPSLRLEPLTLTSRTQRISAQGTLRRGQVDASMGVDSLDLGRLPRVLVPGSLGLAGVVSGSATVVGPLGRPDVTATVRAQDVSVTGVTHVTGTVEGTFLEGIARGTASVSSSLGSVQGSFDVPVDAVLDGGAAPFLVEATFQDVSLEALQSWRAQTWPVTGMLAGRLQLKGPANDPAVALTIDSTAVTVTPTGPLTRAVAFESTTLGVSSRDDGALTVSLTTKALGAGATLTLETPVSIRSLRAALPSAETARTMPLAVRAEVTDLPLETLRTFGLTGTDDVKGFASVQVNLSGSVDDPRGLVRLSWRGVEAPPLEALEGQLELAASEALTRLSGQGRLSGRPLFEVDAFIDAPVRRLEQLEALGPEHVTARLSLAPMPLGRLLPKRDDDVVATGSVTVDVGIKGTLDDPSVSIDATVQSLSFGKVPLGQARLVSRTQGRAQSLAVTLKAAGNSELRATGSVGLDPSITLLRKGLDVSAVPFDLGVTATAFDLGFLSGVTPMVRTVAGQLSLEDFKITGALGSPDVRGSVAWQKGRLALASFGDYRDIDVDVKVSNERLDLKTLSVRSGSGALVLDPSWAQRQPTGVWHLEGSGTAARFALVTDDQLMAILSAKASLEGDVSPTLIDLSRIELSRVEVELPEVKRKDVQDLERPKDVVLTRGGRVVAGRRRSDGSPSQPGSTRTWRGEFTAPRNLWVRSSDLNVELGLSEGFRVEYADTMQLFGEAQVLGGRIDVIGREFKINRVAAGSARAESTVRFTGLATEPLVNVRAEHTNEREKVKVAVSVTGRGKNVAFKVSSEPPMPESDIYTLLATGRRDLRRSSGTSITAEQAVSVVGSLAANELKNALLKKLPIDIVDVVSIDTGSEGLASTRVEVGKYLSDSLYLGYTFQPGANKARGENTHAGRLELQLSKNVCLEATAGDAPAAGADVVWSRDW